MDLIEIGNNVSRLRKKKGMSLEQLAEQCGYGSRSAIYKIERGIIEMPLSKAYAMADALDVGISDLILLQDKRDPHLSLEDIRKINKLTKEDMARIMGVSEEDYEFYLDCPNEMECAPAVRLCRTLNIGTQYLKTGL